MSSSPPLLEVADLVRHYGGTVALGGVAFSVSAGEVVALLGENGAGKSTLVEIVGGGLRADRGRMLLAGAPYLPRDPLRARASGVAVVHQHFQLVEAFTVAENLSLSLGSIPSAELDRRRGALEGDLGLRLPPVETPVRALSVGERQWLEVARALLTRPRLLLLDEPTAVLTPGESERLFATVRGLSERGVAVLFITHRLDEVRRAADRVLVLRRGLMVAQLPSQAPTAELAAAMTGEETPVAAGPERTPGPLVARLRGVASPPRLQPLDLELQAGEVVVLAGVDGNGQVEAAARLAGLSRGPGTVEVGGERVRRPEPDVMRRLGVVVIPADRAREGVVPTLSVAENLVLGTPLRVPLRWPELALKAEEMIGRYALVGRPEQPAGELSGGNQQKLVVARALEGRPRVVVAMHPTRGLDLHAQVAVRRLLLEAAAAGTAVLAVTADLEEARELGDRILVLSRGRVVGRGDRATPFSTLARWLGGEVA